MARWAEGRWVLQTGRYILGVGDNVGALHVVATVAGVTGTQTWGF